MVIRCADAFDMFEIIIVRGAGAFAQHSFQRKGKVGGDNRYLLVFAYKKSELINISQMRESVPEEKLID